MAEVELTLEFNKQRKTVLKGNLTRFTNKLAKFKDGDSVSDLKAKLLKQDRESKEFDRVLTIITCATESTEEQDALYEEGEEYNINYTSARNKTLILLGHVPEEPKIPTQISHNSALQSSSATQIPKQVILQPITLPKFDGKLNMWSEFADLFKTLVIDNKALSNIEKLMHLKSCLIAEAANILVNISSRECNFDVAWDMLKRQYENPKLLIETHIKALFTLPKICNDTTLRDHLSKFNSNCRILKAADGLTVDNLLIQFSLTKYDEDTREKWEEFAYDIKEPKFEDIIQFLTQRSHIKNVISSISIPPYSNKREQKPMYMKTHMAVSSSTQAHKCNFCAGSHRIYDCAAFRKLSPKARLDAVQSKKLCINCLGNAHYIKQCNSKRACFICQKRHNTLLHDTVVTPQAKQDTRYPLASKSPPQTLTQTPTTSNHTQAQDIERTEASLTLHSALNSSQILLSTVIVDVKNSNGKRYECRALLDNGSQPHLVTSAFIKRMGLPYTQCSTKISGIGTSATNTVGYVTLHIFSKYNTYEAKLCTTIVDKITHNIPSHTIDRSLFHLPENVQLADPNFDVSRSIDLIIGADLFYQLLCSGNYTNTNGPTLQETLLGWVISGRVPVLYPCPEDVSLHVQIIDPLEAQLQRFWELESVHNSTEEESENYCETHFKETVSRNGNGRFIVKLPFTPLKNELGFNYVDAERRLVAIENRLGRNPALHTAYTQFMKEYEELGHMTKCKATTTGYFIPHHAVLREQSLTTKCRCVFDASAKSSTGLSLNDILYVGPVVQDDLFTILLRFRTHPVVFTADIERMYRQFLVHQKDTHYQQILWRSSPTEPISVYRLQTVTYGTASAPFLATRCLKELALQAQSYPDAAKVILNDFYVDDCITGCASVSEARNLKRDLISVLNSAGLPLKKWRSNVAELMNDSELSALSLNKSTMNTLGLSWDHVRDVLLYLPSSSTSRSKVTKRSILSEVAKLFDPLGVVAPVVLKAKLLLQKLWKLDYHWDQHLPEDICKEWSDYSAELGKLVQISVPRCVLVSTYDSIELHGFSDASLVAYGCCIYIRTLNVQGIPHTQLLCAKSRVAPVKTATQCDTTLPRLELCGALLLAQLMRKVGEALKMNFHKSVCWSDSSIVLCWLASPPQNYKPFVSNRVREIQKLTPHCEWRHVRSESNPADCISRGLNTFPLRDNQLWWCGPSFLQSDSADWPQLDVSHPVDTRECKLNSISTFLVVQPLDLVNRYSSLVKLVRIHAYCLRFIKNCKAISPSSGLISAVEYRDSLHRLIKIEQRKVFEKEVSNLQRKQPISPSSRLFSLNPFLDKDDILRVGGRLRHASISTTQQHPIILPPHNPLTTLIVNYEHLRTLHAGQQSVLASLRTSYWPLFGKSTVRKLLRNCVRCCRVRPKLVQYLMGDLPRGRVTSSRPFSSCGIDYCGPFMIVPQHRKGARVSKVYVAVFVCFATKATHMELVGDLTTEACLNALRRFISRRGIISHLYSDNGTNFRGCNSELKRIARFLLEHKAQVEISTLQIQWHFIPPQSPHFGGLWEASVKAAKYHLRRIAGQATLTVEELSTILAQTEAVLNSRPLTPISTDINDLGALTPGHFLIGQPLTTLPDVNLQDVPVNRLSRWQRVQQLNQHFWQRWHREYLSELQQRTKWKHHFKPLCVGDMVIVREENASPLTWKLGRVLAVSVSADKVPRVATVRTAKGEETLAVKRLCLLPIDH